MNKVKLRFITIISLFVLFALFLGLAIGALSPAHAGAITYAPSSIFWAKEGGEVRAFKENAEAEDVYLAFVFTNDGGSVEYHRDLALKWFVADEAENAKYANPGKATYYTMQFSFPEVNFTTYTLTFQSEEENISKKGQSVNEIVFEKSKDGLVVYVKDAEHQDEDAEYEDSVWDKHAVAEGDITLALNEDGITTAGEFNVTLNGEVIGKFLNVGGYFMEYRTSGTANTPMTFTAELPENATQKVIVKNLNGQEFLVTGGEAGEADADGTVLYEGGRVEDNAPPVLVLSEKLYAFTLGQRFSLSYEAIDVCDDSVTVRRSYYMATKDENGYVKPNEETDDDYKTLTTSTYLMPPNDDNDAQEEYVSIRFNLDDGSDISDDYYVYLSWYADLEADVVRVLGEGENKFDYILVDRERSAPYYTIITAKDGENETSDDYDTVKDKYQEELNAVAENVSAGDGAYFYLPSLRSLFASDYADYRNLRFSIYYYKPGQAEGSTASSVTSLRYNSLRFEIEKPGKYKFRILAADAAGNVLQLYQDGQLVNVTSSNIWDIEEIPDFTIEVGYSGAVIEDMGEQTQGYRGTSYSITDFDIVALADCEKEYSLYYFDTDKVDQGLAKLDYHSAADYSDFVKNAKSYFEEVYDGCFTPIRKYVSSITEDDAAWKDTDNDYHWNPGSTPGSFTPQKSGFYVVKLLLVDPNRANEETTAYQVIRISNPIDQTPGVINWLENNVTSVVLFSISAVLAVVIVVLFVVKPSDKNVEEVDLDKLKGKKNNKK